jgi:hypothetical protein
MGDRRGTRRVEIIEILTSDRAVARWEPTRDDEPTHRPAAVALIAISLFVVAALVVNALASDDHAAVKAPPTTEAARLAIVPSPTVDTVAPAAMAFTGGTCSDDRVPFRTTFLPYGWTTDGAAWSGPDLLTGSSGAVRAVHGPIIPVHGDPVSSLTVLGVPASIAPVADGYSVEFVLGAPSDLCDHWALVSSKGVDAATLQRIAEGMTPFEPGTQSLECQGAYTLPEAELVGRTVVLDSVALPTSVELDTLPAHLPNGTLALFARESLEVRAGAAFRLAVDAASTGRLALDWQSNSNAAPATSVTVPGCGADTSWIVFYGGFWVLQPGCFTLVVDANGREQQVRVGIGMACP